MAKSVNKCPAPFTNQTIISAALHCLTVFHPFYLCDNFPNCKLIQITFGRNIADKIWNKLTHINFDICLLCVISLCRKRHQFFSQLHKVKILVPHFRQFCDDELTILSGNGEYNLWVGLLGRPPRDSAIPWAGPGTQSPLAVRYGAVWAGGA